MTNIRPKWGDFLSAVLVLLAAAVLTGVLAINAFGTRQITVQIHRDGQLIKEMPLSTDSVYTVEGDYQNTVTIKDGKAAVTFSNCPGVDCVHSGWISEAGRTIVCLPNKMELRLTGQGEIDAFTR